MSKPRDLVLGGSGLERGDRPSPPAPRRASAWASSMHPAPCSDEHPQALVRDVVPGEVRDTILGIGRREIHGVVHQRLAASETEVIVEQRVSCRTGLRRVFAAQLFLNRSSAAGELSVSSFSTILPAAALLVGLERAH